MQDINATVQGRVAADPEMRVSNRTGSPFTTFRVASTPRRQVSGQPGAYEDGDTSWFTVFAFGHLGANLLKSIRKGEPVVVHGRLQVRDFKREDGSFGTKAELFANTAGHDLTWGQAAYEKVAKPSYGELNRFDDASRTMQEGDELGDPESDDYLLAERPLTSVPDEQQTQVAV